MKVFYWLFPAMLLFNACSNSKKGQERSLPVMDIEEGLTDFSTHNLDEYATDIRYVKLETTPHNLVNGDIVNLFLENNKIIIHDADPFLKVFDATTGEYLYNIGKKGQGPGELAYLSKADINVKENRVLLSGSVSSYLYDMNGIFIDRIPQPESSWADSVEWITSNVSILDKDIFAGGVITNTGHQTAAAVIYDKQATVLNILPSYRDYIQAGAPVFNPFGQAGTFYRALDETRFFRLLCDTIYTYNAKEKCFDPALCFRFGKHLSAFTFGPGNENPRLIQAVKICENNHFLFIDFNTMSDSPEPFEEEILRGPRWIKYTNNNIRGIYDKNTQKLHFLLQPIPTLMGMKDNIDNGLPFWPVNISSKNELISYCHSYNFIERISKLSNPNKMLVEMINQMDEDDNPVIIIAKGRK